MGKQLSVPLDKKGIRAIQISGDNQKYLLLIFPMMLISKEKLVAIDYRL